MAKFGKIKPPQMVLGLHWWRFMDTLRNSVPINKRFLCFSSFIRVRKVSKIKNFT